MTSPRVIVIGSGVAGLMTTLRLATRGAKVSIVTKAGFAEGGSSVWAQGGVAAAVGADDSPHLHGADTLKVAGGLAEREAVDILTREGPERIEELLELGAAFDRTADGALALGREAAHSRSRIVHAGGDLTGAELVRVLRSAVQHHAQIRLVDHTFAGDLVKTRTDEVIGVRVYTRSHLAEVLRADAVVLATGGIGGLYAATTNPVGNTGDGLALAARAGARLADLEFVQFHPTALAVPGDPKPLLSEAIRGAGGVLLSVQGSGTRTPPDGSLAPRDVLARWVWLECQAGAAVYLDARRALGARFQTCFPTAAAHCRAAGLDPAHEPIPVLAAAHYHMGGVATDTEGRTSLRGLWACGEVAATGVHGANRLASNSLLEALVFGARVAEAIVCERSGPQTALVRQTTPKAWSPQPAGLRQALRASMSAKVGVVRTETGLDEALEALSQLQANLTGGTSELHNMVTVAGLVAQAARARRESRGSHSRGDFPTQDAAFAGRSYLTLDPHHEKGCGHPEVIL